MSLNNETVMANNFSKKMLEVENISPRKLAYDRPSDKLISFLKKHYKLEKYVPQNNNFIVYDDYYQEEKAVKPSHGYYGSSEKRNYKEKYEETKINPQKQNPKVMPYNDVPKKQPEFSEQFNSKYSSAQSIRSERKYNEYDIELLSNKFENVKLTGNNQKQTDKKTDKAKNNNQSSPWATDQNASMFPTSSSQYGAHYFNKKYNNV
jgi:hypothetical protein